MAPSCGFSGGLSDLDHPNGRSLKSLLKVHASRTSGLVGCTFREHPLLRRGDCRVSDHEREPPGVKMAPKAVVGRVSLYLRRA